MKAFHKFLSSGWVIQPHVVDTHISNAIVLAEFSVRHAPQDHKSVDVHDLMYYWWKPFIVLFFQRGTEGDG